MVYVNSQQSKKERRIKYAIARLFGYSYSQSERMKDWRKNVLIKQIYQQKILHKEHDINKKIIKEIKNVSKKYYKEKPEIKEELKIMINEIINKINY